MRRVFAVVDNGTGFVIGGCCLAAVGRQRTAAAAAGPYLLRSLLRAGAYTRPLLSST
jgi:hypothetical protein